MVKSIKIVKNSSCNDRRQCNKCSILCPKFLQKQSPNQRESLYISNIRPQYRERSKDIGQFFILFLISMKNYQLWKCSRNIQFNNFQPFHNLIIPFIHRLRIQIILIFRTITIYCIFILQDLITFPCTIFRVNIIQLNLIAFILLQKLVIHEMVNIMFIRNELSPYIISKSSRNTIDDLLSIFFLYEIWLKMREKDSFQILFLSNIQSEPPLPYFPYPLILFLLLHANKIQYINSGQLF